MEPTRPKLPREAIELYNRYPGAVHGFNNDATPERYNKAAADQAWQRTIDWFNKYVRG
jgi:dienelactone hydrolase